MPKPATAAPAATIDPRDLEINRLQRAMHHMVTSLQLSSGTAVCLRKALSHAEGEAATLKIELVKAAKLQADTWAAAVQAVAATAAAQGATIDVSMLANEGPEMVADIVEAYRATKGGAA